MTRFRRMKLTSIISRNDADTIPTQWVMALARIARHPVWGAQERELILRYARCLTHTSPDSDSVYPHHPRYTGSLHGCLLYYIGYWSGRMRELIKRWQVGDYSPRAWGLLRQPLEELKRDPIPYISFAKDGGQYVAHLV